MKRATQAFFPGEGPIVNTDTVYADDHPYVAMYPAMFVEVEVVEKPVRRGRPPNVEQATAAPGEKRGG